MSEAQEQIAVVNYCDIIGVPIYHVPNGGSRNKIEAANLKRQGVKSGVPDLCIPVARCGYHGLYIEMKTKTGRVSDNQKKWLSLLRDNGYAAFVARGSNEAIKLIDHYINGFVKAPEPS